MFNVLDISVRRLQPLAKFIIGFNKYKMATGSTSNLLSILKNNPKRFERIKFLARLYQDNGYELRIAGGAVRDILRNVEPHDIDFATTATPEQSLEILSRHEDLVRIIVTAAGQRHGTVAIKFKQTDIDLKKVKLDLEEQTVQDQKVGDNIKKDKPEYDQESPYEITTLRFDKVTDGRHAEVEFITDWKQDAERRDLTINAMFLTIDNGKLVDYFDGHSDLQNGIVRFVGDPDKRIKEDYLRILRYFRFWSRYGTQRQPDEETASTIKLNLDGLDGISGERIWQELKKIYSYLPCSCVTKLMLNLGVLQKLGFKTDDQTSCIVLEEVTKVEEHLRDCKESFKSQKAVPDKKVSLISDKIQDLLPVIMIATLLRSGFDVSRIEELKTKFRFSNLERDVLLYIMEHRDQNPTVDKFKSEIVMAPNDKSNILLKILSFMIYRGNHSDFQELENWDIPTFPIRGNDIAKEYSKRKIQPTRKGPGSKSSVPQIGDILNLLKSYWVESNYTHSQSELEMRLCKILDEIERNQKVDN